MKKNVTQLVWLIDSEPERRIESAESGADRPGGFVVGFERAGTPMSIGIPIFFNPSRIGPDFELGKRDGLYEE